MKAGRLSLIVLASALLPMLALWGWHEVDRVGLIDPPSPSAVVSFQLSIQPAMAPGYVIEIRSDGDKAWISCVRPGLKNRAHIEVRKALSPVTWKNVQFLAHQADLSNLPAEDPYESSLDGYVVHLTASLEGRETTLTRQMAFRNYKHLREEPGPEGDPFKRPPGAPGLQPRSAEEERLVTLLVYIVAASGAEVGLSEPGMQP